MEVKIIQAYNILDLERAINYFISEVPIVIDVRVQPIQNRLIDRPEYMATVLYERSPKIKAKPSKKKLEEDL